MTMEMTETESYWMALGEIAAVLFGVVAAVSAYRWIPPSPVLVKIVASTVAFVVVFKVMNGFVHSGRATETNDDQEPLS